MKQTHVTAFVLATVLTLAAGCSSTTASDDLDSNERSDTDDADHVSTPDSDDPSLMSLDLDEEFDITEIRTAEDGSQIVKTGKITRREQVRRTKFELARREALARGVVLQDTMAISGSTALCTTTGNLQVYDQVWFMGNEICFIGTGNASLASFHRTFACGLSLGWYGSALTASCTPIGSAVNWVRSMRGGVMPGAFTTGPWCNSGAGTCYTWGVNTFNTSIPSSSCGAMHLGVPSPLC